MITGGIGMGLAMLLIGILYATGSVHADTGAARWIVIVTVFVYLVICCITWCISCKVYIAEVQAQRTRAAATNLAHGSNWVTNFLVALTTPVLLNRSSSGAYFLWSGCLLLTAAVCMVFMVETMGRSLDDIEADFQAESIGKRARRKVGGGLLWWKGFIDKVSRRKL
jgi:high-affinity Fe2+/Pb2+ permease